MSNAELKSKVYKELESLDDYLLEEILNLIQIEKDHDEVIKIPDYYRESLNKSIAQMEKGEVIPNEIVEKKIEKWLYK